MPDKSPPQIKVNRWRRYAEWDERPLRLDKFAVEDAAHGFSAFTSPTTRNRDSISRTAGQSMDGVLPPTST